MATYKKRGYKPKATKENDGADGNFNEEESTTAEVFNNLDEGANKTEEWVAGNQKPILIVIGVIVFAVLAYMAYSRFVQQPKEFEAADEIAQSQIYFENALDATNKDQDSLFNLALNGGNGKFGLLKVIDNYLQVKGNGNYKLDMPLDEEEQLVIINDDLIETKEKSIKINVEELKNVLKTHKASVAETMEVPCLVGYYFNEKAITTNRFLVTTTNINLFGREVLLSSSLAELLYLFKEDIKVIVTNNRAIFENENLKISGYIMDEIADYPVESIEKISASVFDYSIKIDKKSLLQAVDRLTLFVDPFDENGIYLDFETSGVSLKNKKSNGTEFVEYDKESKEEIKFRCFSDIEFLVSQLNSYPEDTVEIEFGSKVLIKFKSENVTQMLALLTPEGDDE